MKQTRMDSHYLDWVIYLNNLGEVTLVTSFKYFPKFHKSNFLLKLDNLIILIDFFMLNLLPKYFKNILSL